MSKLTELEQQLEELQRAILIERENCKYEKWNHLKLCEDEIYYVILRGVVGANVQRLVFKNTELDRTILTDYNCFRTFAECKKWENINDAFYKASFKPDWEDAIQPKFYISYDFFDNECCIQVIYGCCNGQKYFFESEDVCSELIERFGHKDIAKYVLGVKFD